MIYKVLTSNPILPKHTYTKVDMNYFIFDTIIFRYTMIPSDLLRYKIDYKNNKIYPLLCSIDNNSSEYQVAKKIIEIFDECYINKNNKDKLNYMIKLLEYT